MTELTPEERTRIYEEEKSRRESPRRRFSPVGIVIMSACVLAFLTLGIGFAYRQYRVDLLKGKLDEAIGRDLGMTETILKVETESEHMTYGELFKMCERSVEDRTKLIVELRGLYPELNYSLKSHLIEYLNAENELVRSKSAFYRKSMEFSTNMKIYRRELGDIPASEYGWEFYRDRTAKTKAELVESAGEAVKSATDFLATFDNVAKREAVIASEAREAGLHFNPIFQKYAESNQKAAQDLREAATEVAAKT